MALTTNDIVPAAAAPSAPTPTPAPANSDPAMKAILGIVGGDEAAAKETFQKALAQQGGSLKTAPGIVIEPLEPKDPESQTLPEEVLSIPSFRALLNGEPPAISSVGAEKDPEIAIIANNVQPLLYAGFGFYRNKADTTSYLYNGRFIDGNALKIADEKGKLDEIVPPFSELKSAFTKGLAETPVETPAEATPIESAPAQPAVPPVPASSTKALTNARLKNIAMGSPTSGPVPGQGRILNSVLKPTV